MVLQLQVDCAFTSRQLDLMNMLNRRDVLNLRNVLPHKAIQKLLSKVVAPSMPCCRMDFAESVEFLRLGLLLCACFLALGATFRIVLDSEVYPHESRDTPDGGEVTDGWRTREDPLVARCKAEKGGERLLLKIGKLVGDDSSEAKTISL